MASLWTKPCPDCKKSVPDIVIDHTSGDMICRDCGLVIADKMIDESAEWREISNGIWSKDASRVGAPAMNGIELGTVVAKTEGKASGVLRTHNQVTAGPRGKHYSVVFEKIEAVGSAMMLPEHILSRAQKIYKRLDASQSQGSRARNLDGLVAALIFATCRQEGMPRTLKEICLVSKLTKKEVGRCYNHLVKLEDSDGNKILSVGAATAADYLCRFCASLKLDASIVQVALQVAENISRHGIASGKSPVSVAAATIYFVCGLHDESAARSADDVAGVSHVCTRTLRDVYRDLCSAQNMLLSPERRKSLGLRAAPIEFVASA